MRETGSLAHGEHAQQDRLAAAYDAIPEAKYTAPKLQKLTHTLSHCRGFDSLICLAFKCAFAKSCNDHSLKRVQMLFRLKSRAKAP